MTLLWLAACASRTSPDALALQEIWSSTRDEALVIEALRARRFPGPDEELLARLRRWLRERPDDLWLAETLVTHGPEPLWPSELLQERRLRTRRGWQTETGPIRGVLGVTDEGRDVEAWFVAGRDEPRALVIGGVHGSEASGIEVVERLLAALALEGTPTPRYDTVLVPSLFPDHAAARLREDPAQPTNRNFPEPGASLATASASGTPTDALGRPILPENVMLLELVERFDPVRIASVHATVRPGAAGIFGDPHTVEDGADEARLADAGLRSAEDEMLALRIAESIAEAGHPDAVVGNHLHEGPVASWSGRVDGGTSLGGWGPRAVAEGGAGDRPSLGVITVEVDQQHRSDDLWGTARQAREDELRAIAEALREGFLED